MFKRASSACHHPAGVTVAARSVLVEPQTVAAHSVLVEPRAPDNEKTWERMEAKLPEEDQTRVFEAAAAAVAAISSDPEEESGPNRRPDEEFDPQVALVVINSRNALSGADGLGFSHLQSIIRTASGRDKFGAGIEISSRKELSMIQMPFRGNSGSSSCNPTSLLWVKNAAPSAWG